MRHIALLSIAMLTACGGGDSTEKLCELFVECEPDAGMTVDECVADSESAEEPTTCATEYNDLNDCIADLGNCTDWDAYWAGVPGEGGYPCADEDDAYYNCG